MVVSPLCQAFLLLTSLIDLFSLILHHSQVSFSVRIKDFLVITGTPSTLMVSCSWVWPPPVDICPHTAPKFHSQYRYPHGPCTLYVSSCITSPHVEQVDSIEARPSRDSPFKMIAPPHWTEWKVSLSINSCNLCVFIIREPSIVTCCDFCCVWFYLRGILSLQLLLRMGWLLLFGVYLHVFRLWSMWLLWITDPVYLHFS